MVIKVPNNAMVPTVQRVWTNILSYRVSKRSWILSIRSSIMSNRRTITSNRRSIASNRRSIASKRIAISRSSTSNRERISRYSSRVTPLSARRASIHSAADSESEATRSRDRRGHLAPVWASRQPSSPPFGMVTERYTKSRMFVNSPARRSLFLTHRVGKLYDKRVRRLDCWVLREIDGCMENQIVADRCGADKSVCLTCVPLMPAREGDRR